MKTAFARGNIKTAFEIRSDFSLTASFSDVLDNLPSKKSECVTALTTYKEDLIKKNYRGTYKRTVLKIIEQLTTAFQNQGGLAIQTFSTVKLVASAKLTVNELYQGYLDGTNDGTGIDEIMLAVLDEIKSASMI
jgi:hypothetical protein